MAVLTLTLAWAHGVASAQTPRTGDPNLPELTAPVNDFANVIDPAIKAELTRHHRRLQRKTGDAVVVATIARVTEPYADIHDYAVKLFENHGRGIGGRGKDTGALVLLSVGDRKVWIEVGYGLEGFITDGFAGETSREYMVPFFRQGKYGEGLRAGVIRAHRPHRAGARRHARRSPRRAAQPGRSGPRARAHSRSAFVILIVFLVLQLIFGSRPPARPAPLGRRFLERLVGRRGPVRRRIVRRLERRRIRRRRVEVAAALADSAADAAAAVAAAQAGKSGEVGVAARAYRAFEPGTSNNEDCYDSTNDASVVDASGARRGARRAARLFLQLVHVAGRVDQGLVGRSAEPAAASQRADPQPRRDGEGLRRAGEADPRDDRRVARQAGRREDPEDTIKAANEQSSALSRLLVIVENYPQLKSEQNFLRLKDELSGTENRIAVARRRYNERFRPTTRCGGGSRRT